MSTLSLLTLLLVTSPPAEPPKLGACTLSGTFAVEDLEGKTFEPEHAEVYVSTRLPMTPRQQEREMGQFGKAFVPRILVVEREDVVVFTNRDPFPHEIHAAKIKNTFMSGMNQKPETFRQLFSETGESTLGCRIHPGMSGTVLTVPNAFHVKVDKDGKWSLSGLPRQPVELVFWQRTGMDSASETRKVTPCVDTNVAVTLKRVKKAKAVPYGGRPTTD